MSDPQEKALALGLEVLRRAARGQSSPEIAEAIGIAEPSVRSRLKRLYLKLGARNVTHAVVIAAIDGLLTKEDLRAAYEDRRTTGEGETNHDS